MSRVVQGAIPIGDFERERRKTKTTRNYFVCPSAETGSGTSKNLVREPVLDFLVSNWKP